MKLSTARKRVIALAVAASVIVTLLPKNAVMGSVAGYTEASAEHIGAVCRIADDGFTLVSFPEQGEGTDAVYGVSVSELPERVVITDFSGETEENAEPMYKLKAAPGLEWPVELDNYRWIEAKLVAVLSEGGETRLTLASGEEAEELSLPEYGRRSVFAESSLCGAVEYQWQLCYDVSAALWTDIKGANTAQINVTYGLLASLLDEDGRAFIRCKSSSGNKTNYSRPLTAAVLPLVSEEGRPAEVRGAASSAQIRRTIKPFGSGAVLYGSEDIKETCNVSVAYSFEDGSIAAPSYTAAVAEGAAFSARVDFPTVQGYLPYVNGVRSDYYEFNISSVEENITVSVVYKPAEVAYTLLHYRQNAENDGYTLVLTEKKQAPTGSTVPESDKSYEGFYSLIYERPAVAADGSTVIEIYYDRYYYLLNFDMGGGYGTEPVYARFGAVIPKLTEPKRAGYGFVGWAESADCEKASALPETMPVLEGGSKTYYAVWKAVDKAKVTVVFWGENADGKGYSYLADSTKEIYLKPETRFTYSEGEMLICDKEPHTHAKACIGCGKAGHVHSELGGACYTLICAEETHAHSSGCYEGAGAAASPLNPPSSPKNGQVYSGRFVFSYSYIYIGGAWYEYSGAAENGSLVQPTCGKAESTHLHGEACYGLTCAAEEHRHAQACYICGKAEHSHNSDCYMQGAGLNGTEWRFAASDTVLVAADGSTVVNVYYERVKYSVRFFTRGSSSSEYTEKKITARWGEFIGDKWPSVLSGGVTSRTWYVYNDGSNICQAYMEIMPVGGDEFYGPRTSGSVHTATYYTERLDGSSDISYGNPPLYYEEHHKDTAYGSGLYITEDDMYDLNGFTCVGYTYSGTSSGKPKYDGAKFFYARNSYRLIFNNGYSNVSEKSVKYGATLSAYDGFTPTVPTEYEPDSVSFGGWYQNPQCTGEKYILGQHKMPANDLILYAKWEPVVHTVDFYLTEDSEEIYNPDITTEENAHFEVRHGEYISREYVEEHLDKKSMNAAKPNGEYVFLFWYYIENGERKPFDPTTSIRKELVLYGEWSSNTLKSFTVKHVLKSNHSIRVADDTHGSGLAGTTKTFNAKGGSELYAAYREGYFPTVRSQSLLLDIDKNELTVIFEYVPAAVAPYTVKYIDKGTGAELVAAKTVSDNRSAVITETFARIEGYMPDAYQKSLVITPNGDNILYFYYTRDTEHAYYQVTHYIQNSDGTGWSEYTSSQSVGELGKRYTASPLNIQGFTYRSIEYTVDGALITDISSEGALLTEKGLQINLYYNRNSYPYRVRYLEQGTGRQLAEPKNGSGLLDAVVSESAKDIDGYIKLEPSSGTVLIRLEEDPVEPKLNIITFYYTERKKTAGLTIEKKLTGDSDATADKGQVFVFSINGVAGTDTADIALTVTVHGEGEVKVNGLPLGVYIVSEQSAWSWRYEPVGEAVMTVTVSADGESRAVFENKRQESRWLDGNASCVNVFGLNRT